MRCIPVYDFQMEVMSFVERGLWAGRRSFGPSKAIGFANEADGLVAGAVFHDYDPDSNVIEVSAFSTKRYWCSRSNLQALFDYPFRQLGVRLLIARHSETNTRARRIWSALGAEEVLIPELWSEGTAAAIAVLRRDTWLNSKFASKEHGQAQSANAA